MSIMVCHCRCTKRTGNVERLTVDILDVFGRYMRSLLLSFWCLQE
jgi:hypothetical protein